MASVPSFPDSGWERIPEGLPFILEQMRQSLTVSIPRRSQGTRKSALEEVV
ncbi:hypothetical protein [Nostoc sp. ChiSLP03a]|uniref:hypothetical protein n=1 Tax=Nostoc sp. ChiSLP03a TaxID=3075380 RepID=UPI002AD5861C|nr:hypothetical protein [Nostoc sp. ChiSLP03a]MDZ8210876.1 hypothetical protein [Nostoc sp. ChiSLP03a]